jgi:stage II sporulation protein D
MDDNAILSYGGKRYRGEILVLCGDAGLIVVNRLSVESYLRGVVPLEIGVDRTTAEEAAVQAQAIAARSYVYTRLNDGRPYDVTATVMDQVYGGIDAERVVSDAAVEVTRDMVLFYNGKVAYAPYHANSGGMTAAASEVWNARDEPYLVSVSDRIPGTDHYYDEQSPNFRWTRSYDADALEKLLNKYLPKYADVPRGGIGKIRGIQETGRTQSGRVAGLVFITERGRFVVRANAIRFVLRKGDADVLPSTLFTMDIAMGGDGTLSNLTLHGTGNGHGVGMDQWGAIARARAGEDCLTILHTYYPGTTVGPVI